MLGTAGALGRVENPVGVDLALKPVVVGDLPGGFSAGYRVGVLDHDTAAPIWPIRRRSAWVGAGTDSLQGGGVPKYLAFGPTPGTSWS